MEPRTLSFPPSRSLNSFIYHFNSFLRSQITVNSLWEIAYKEGQTDFPRHFYTVCSLTPKTQHLGFRSTTPIPLMNRPGVALENYCSFFLHTNHHTYLHSSIGTFVQLLEKTVFSSSSSSSTEISSSHLRQIFTQLMKILLYSSFEITYLISPIFHNIFQWGETTNPKHQNSLFFDLFFSSFICSCLEQPQIILNTPLSKKTISLCLFLASILKGAVSPEFEDSFSRGRERGERGGEGREEGKGNETNHFYHQLQSYGRAQATKIADYILRGEGGEEVYEGYCNDFAPLWEDHHFPCVRDGDKRSTCSMKEPDPCESLKYFCEYVASKRGILMKKIAENSKMGVMSLEGQVLMELVEWVEKEENMSELKRFYSAPTPKSPKMQIRDFLAPSCS